MAEIQERLDKRRPAIMAIILDPSCKEELMFKRGFVLQPVTSDYGHIFTTLILPVGNTD